MVTGCPTNTFGFLVLPPGDYIDQTVRALEAGWTVATA